MIDTSCKVSSTFSREQPGSSSIKSVPNSFKCPSVFQKIFSFPPGLPPETNHQPHSPGFDSQTGDFLRQVRLHRGGDDCRGAGGVLRVRLPAGGVQDQAQAPVEGAPGGPSRQHPGHSVRPDQLPLTLTQGKYWFTFAPQSG